MVSCMNDKVDIFVEDAYKEINDRLTFASFLKGKENLRKELNVLADDVTKKYGLRPEEKLQLQQKVLKTYPELGHL